VFNWGTFSPNFTTQQNILTLRSSFPEPRLIYG
jgi:hypothetical protein